METVFSFEHSGSDVHRLAEILRGAAQEVRSSIAGVPSRVALGSIWRQCDGDADMYDDCLKMVVRTTAVCLSFCSDWARDRVTAVLQECLAVLAEQGVAEAA